MATKLILLIVVIIILGATWFFLPYRPINKRLSDNYYFNFLKTEVHYIPMGNSFELGNYTMKDVDLRSVEVIGGYYLKDKSNVYYQYHAIKDADPGSIKMFSPKSYCFAIDKNMIYFEGHPFKDIDIKSCAFVGDNCFSLLKDKNHIYSTFSVGYYTDENYIIQPVKNLDPNKYQPINNVYGKDHNLVYYKGEPIAGSDPKTFIILEDYAKDTNSVYFDGLQVKNLDPATFECIEGGRYVKDKAGVYFGLSPNEDPSGNVTSFSGSIVAGADPKTFIMIKGDKIDYARDKSTFYWGGKAQ